VPESEWASETPYVTLTGTSKSRARLTRDAPAMRSGALLRRRCEVVVAQFTEESHLLGCKRP
jgi:hypothetical protein